METSMWHQRSEKSEWLMKVEKLKPEAKLLVIDQIKSVTHNFEKTFP